jgi:hypothetical protein
MPDQPTSDAELAVRSCDVCRIESRRPVVYGAPCVYQLSTGPCSGAFTLEPRTWSINPANDPKTRSTS